MPVFDINDVEWVGSSQGSPNSSESPPDDSAKPTQGADANQNKQDSEEVDVDAVHKEIEDKLSRKQDIKDRTIQDLDPQSPTSGIHGPPGQGGGVGNVKKTPPVFAQPKYNWKRLVQLMIPTGVPQKNLSYTKPSARGVTTSHIASQLGAGAMKPGLKSMDVQTRKLALVFDISGSMQQSNKNAMKEIPKLLKSSNFADSPIGVVFFAGDVRMFTVNMKQNYYAPVSHMADLSKTPIPAEQKKGYLNLFNMQEGGGTVFGPTVMMEVQSLINQNYNVIMFSDSDVMWGENWKHFLTLVTKNKDHMSFIADDEATWRAICVKMGHAPAKFGYLD